LSGALGWLSSLLLNLTGRSIVKLGGKGSCHDPPRIPRSPNHPGTAADRGVRPGAVHRRGADDTKADELVALRLERQSILDLAEPPHLITVLDESALRRLVGSPAIMYEQLIHVADVAERPGISIEVVPASTGANAGLSGGFQLASSDGAPDVLNMNGVQDVTEERRSLVRHATRIFDLVRADALPRAASRALMLEAAEQWKT
jgi:Domain of unknown function (DUF5753)